ncbi:hypothetical protein BKA93DRAFT_342584 [Sparassis latifolia]
MVVLIAMCPCTPLTRPQFSEVRLRVTVCLKMVQNASAPSAASYRCTTSSLVIWCVAVFATQYDHASIVTIRHTLSASRSHLHLHMQLSLWLFLGDATRRLRFLLPHRIHSSWLHRLTLLRAGNWSSSRRRPRGTIRVQPLTAVDVATPPTALAIGVPRRTPRCVFRSRPVLLLHARRRRGVELADILRPTFDDVQETPKSPFFSVRLPQAEAQMVPGDFSGTNFRRNKRGGGGLFKCASELMRVRTKQRVLGALCVSLRLLEVGRAPIVGIQVEDGDGWWRVQSKYARACVGVEILAWLVPQARVPCDFTTVRARSGWTVFYRPLVLDVRVLFPALAPVQIRFAPAGLAVPRISRASKIAVPLCVSVCAGRCGEARRAADPTAFNGASNLGIGSSW